MSQPPPSPAPPATPSPVTRDVDGEAPTCPRCGYDLSVATQLWPVGSCPLHGLCNECGLDFEWGEVLHTSRVPWWVAEHAPKGMKKRARTWLGAMVIPLAPWKAMRDLRMTLELRPLRALSLPLLLLSLWYALGALASFLVHVLPTTVYSSWAPSAPPTATRSAWFPNPESLVSDAVQSLVWPMSGGRLPGSGWDERLIASMFTIVIALHAVLMVASFAFLRVTLRRISIRREHFVRLVTIAAIPVLGIATVALVVRATLATLDHTDVLSLWYGIPSEFVRWEPGSGFSGAPNVMFLAYLVWSLTYWWSACRWYLRLPQPFWHASMLFAIASLLTIGIMFILSSSFWWWLLSFTGV